LPRIDQPIKTLTSTTFDHKEWDRCRKDLPVRARARRGQLRVELLLETLDLVFARLQTPSRTKEIYIYQSDSYEKRHGRRRVQLKVGVADLEDENMWVVVLVNNQRGINYQSRT